MKLIISAIVVLLILVIYLAVQEQRVWNQYIVDHACKVVGREKGHSSVGYGLMTNGTMGTVVTSTPSKTGWLCDDGVTYWR